MAKKMKLVEFLGSWKGIGTVVVLSLFSPMLLGTNPSTYIQSVAALVFSQLILMDSNRREKRADERDVAMHKKLDGIVKALPEVPSELAGIEPK